MAFHDDMTSCENCGKEIVEQLACWGDTFGPCCSACAETLRRDEEETSDA